MRIPPGLSEWLNLLARWTHVFAGIMWVGTTYYFTWLDGRFQEGAQRPGGQVWMVHSGGFYVVEKRAAFESGHTLHWFRWEAAATWLSGFFLLLLLYYWGGGLLDAGAPVSFRTGALVGLGALVLGWVVYDLLLRSPLGRRELTFAVVSYLLVVAASYGLTRVLSGRAAYLHLGAMFGTIMAANVWMRILPAQRRMLAALREGRTPDAALGAQAKLRSKHNTFMVVPVVFTMISNHFPVATYGHDYNWAILSALVLLGWLAAKILRRA